MFTGIASCRPRPPLSSATAKFEANSLRLVGTLADCDRLWRHCLADLMAEARTRLEQEVRRRGGRYAHVLSEAIDAKRNDATGEAWLHGRFRPGGHMRRALDQFPTRPTAERIWRTYFVPGGEHATKPFAPVPLHDVKDPPETVELGIAANFVEVLLARDGHANPVGINYLEKIQIPHLASIYGAMLAGVDYVLMGAGIPFRVPGVLDRLARHEAAHYPLALAGHAADDDAVVSFDPRAHLRQPLPPLKRPAFLAIVGSHVLAAALLKRANGTIEGFVVKGPPRAGTIRRRAASCG